VAQYVTHVTTRDPVVFITVDDGSFRDPAFLARVRRQHLPVTVFLTNAASGGAHATYFRALQSAGAVIEDHTLKHPDLTRLTAAERRTEICGAADKDRRSFQRRPALLRPPYGHWDSAVMATARECGLHAVVGWDVVMPQSGGLQTWDGRQRLHAGDIVILHFLPGLDGQVERLLGIIRAQHLRVGQLENYV
jgi:peptidoglycan/xylan/chitin deacetylase (PgdA/CDA1 family)